MAGLFGAPAAGIVTGVVTYDGRPAAGKRVTLATSANGTGTTVATDANGRYTFANVASRKWMVTYKSQGDGANVFPNEIDTWRSLQFDVSDGAGKEVPSFEVAHNGLLSPDDSAALVIGGGAVVPLHWSTYARAQRYRTVVMPDSQAGGTPYRSSWTADPYAYFSEQQIATGRYRWYVEIDGGDSGQGTTRSRIVDLGP